MAIDETVSCFIDGRFVSGLPLIKKNPRTVHIQVRDGNTGKLRVIVRRRMQHKVRIHEPGGK